MKKIWVLTGLLVAFICLGVLSSSCRPVSAASGTISTDLPLYPLWGVGGTVKATAVNFAPNETYYLWLQNPRQPVPYALAAYFTVGSNGSSTGISFTIASTDPPGTYTLTVSNSAQIDTTTALTHFGVVGTDSQVYQRTWNVTFAGGGFAANSSISLRLAAGNGTYPNFPRNITADGKGDYQYTFKLPTSATTGAVNATLTGMTFDHQPASTYSTFSVQPALISVKPIGTTAAQVERTAVVTSTYQLSYPNGSPVVSANATVQVVSGLLTVADEPLRPVNATEGKWAATWVPPPSANTTSYQFVLDPTRLFDPYGNSGQSPLISSSDFKVTEANLRPMIQTNSTRQRTQTAFIAISGLYHNGTSPANVTQATMNLTPQNGRQITLNITLSGTQVTTDFKIPINATVGNWTVGYRIQDRWNNSASGVFTIQVIPAAPVFQLITPSSVERTTPLGVVATVTYPDGTGWNKTITSAVSYGNETWPITLNFNSTTRIWSGSYYVVQNATLGPYNVTWSASDSYGNGGAINSTVAVVPAQFTIIPWSSSSTVVSFSNLDLPVTVTYPNGTALPNSYGNLTFGNVTASYKNSTGGTFTLPLADNETSGIWHMYMTTQSGTFTFSFSAVDRFGNTGTATDAYKLVAKSAAAILSQRLIIAGVVGTLIPVGVLFWAVATVSTRRRKHKP